MATLKISELTELGTQPASTDLFVVVDTSTNETKKVAYSVLFGSPSITTAAITTANIGTCNVSTEANFADGIKANFGAGDDLQIYHNGTNSYIADVNAASDLVIQSDLIVLQASDLTTMATFAEGGASTLYHNNVARLATSATGVSVTGDLTPSGVIYAADGAKATPSITFANDTNTGLFSGANDFLGVSVAGASVMNFVGTDIYVTRTTEATGIPTSSEPWMRLDGDITYGMEIHNAATGIYFNDTTGSYSAASFRILGVSKGSIFVDSGGTTYNTTSDYRLKENLAPLDNAVSRVKQLNPLRFNFIGSAKTVDGFLAHEAQAVVPESVTGEKDAVDENGLPVYQGIDQSKLVPLLVAAIKELTARIEALEGV